MAKIEVLTRIASAIEEANSIQRETLQYLRARDADLEDDRRRGWEEHRAEVAARKAENEAQMAALGEFSGSLRGAAEVHHTEPHPCWDVSSGGRLCALARGHAGGHRTEDSQIGWANP